MHSLKPAVGPFESNKTEITEFINNKFVECFEDLRNDNISYDLLKGLVLIHKISVILLNFKNTPEEITKINQDSLLKRSENRRSHRKIYEEIQRK